MGTWSSSGVWANLKVILGFLCTHVPLNRPPCVTGRFLDAEGVREPFHWSNFALSGIPIDKFRSEAYFPLCVTRELKHLCLELWISNEPIGLEGQHTIQGSMCRASQRDSGECARRQNEFLPG